jgi:hypothetical protein
MTAQTSRSNDLRQFFALIVSLIDLVMREVRDVKNVVKLLEVVKGNPRFAEVLHLSEVHAVLRAIEATHAEVENVSARAATRMSPKWREEDGVIYFSVTSDGTTGKDWITRLEGKGFRIQECDKEVLRSRDFKPTRDVTTEIAVLKGALFVDAARTTKNIRAEAYVGTFTQGRNLFKPNVEVACLIREMFMDKELKAMGFEWIVTMHEPVRDSNGDLCLLTANRCDDGRLLDWYYERPDHIWDRCRGFAFAVSETKA